MAGLPEGTVTLLFTDIEGSTLLVQKLGDRYGEALATQRALLRSAVEAAGGHEIDTQGDSFFIAFATVRDALEAAVAAQRALAGEEWPADAEVRLRMGIHTGEPAVETRVTWVLTSTEPLGSVRSRTAHKSSSPSPLVSWPQTCCPRAPRWRTSGSISSRTFRGPSDSSS